MHRREDWATEPKLKAAADSSRNVGIGHGEGCFISCEDKLNGNWLKLVFLNTKIHTNLGIFAPMKMKTLFFSILLCAVMSPAVSWAQPTLVDPIEVFEGHWMTRRTRKLPCTGM